MSTFPNANKSNIAELKIPIKWNQRNQVKPLGCEDQILALPPATVDFIPARLMMIAPSKRNPLDPSTYIL